MATDQVFISECGCAVRIGPERNGLSQVYLTPCSPDCPTAEGLQAEVRRMGEARAN